MVLGGTEEQAAGQRCEQAGAAPSGEDDSVGGREQESADPVGRGGRHQSGHGTVGRPAACGLSCRSRATVTACAKSRRAGALPPANTIHTSTTVRRGTGARGPRRLPVERLPGASIAATMRSMATATATAATATRQPRASRALGATRPSSTGPTA